MMISPNTYLDIIKEKPYEELLKERDRLIRDIRKFEKGKIPKEQYLIEPSPEVIYQMNHQYLAKLCEYISERYNQEFIWKE